MNKEISSIFNIKYAILDSQLAIREEDSKLLLNIINNSHFTRIRKIVLAYEDNKDWTKDLTENNFPIITIKNKAMGIDIEKILDYVSKEENYTIKTLKDKIYLGKKILYLTVRNNKWINWFKESQECCGFWNLTTGLYCPHNCLYCFLNLTDRIRPIPAVYLNISRFKREMSRFKTTSNCLLNCGESNDPLAFEPILNTFNSIAKIVTSKPNTSLLTVTKSCNVYDLDHELKNVIFSWSINPVKIQRMFELDSATTEQRFKAAKYVSEELGYPIRFRIDPIICPDLFDALSKNVEIDWNDYNDYHYELEPYLDLINKILELNVDGITLGTFRAYNPLFNCINSFKDLKGIMIRDTGHLKMPSDFRNWAFGTLKSYIEQYDCKVRVGFCKDIKWKNDKYCNCLL